MITTGQAVEEGGPRRAEVWGVSANAAKLDTIYRQYGVAVRQRVQQIVRDPNEAEDITHAAFERLLGVLGSNKPVRNERALVYATATNLALNHLRHRKVIDKHADAVAHHDLIVMRGEGENEAEMSQRHRALDAAIRSLPEKCRMAFVLCKIKGLTYRQAAERMGVSEHMIKKHVQRGMRLCVERASQYGAQR